MESKLLKKVENAILNDEYGITKINEVKCTKCNNKNVQCIQQLITNIGIDLLTLPNHYNFNEDIL